MRSLLLLIVSCLLLTPACSRNSSKAAASTGGSVVWLSNGWSDGERSEYYHLPEGSELMPYALLANLVSVKTGQPFLTQLERFGFLPDDAGPANPHGLPVGVTVARSRDASSPGLEMVGFSCAACHVGEITYGGKRLRLDGAPAMINLQAYQIEFADSLNATMADPRKLLALVIAMEKTKNGGDAAPPDAATAYAKDPAVNSAAAVQERATRDPAFHSVSSSTADRSRTAGAGVSFQQRLETDVALLKARLAYVKHGKLIVDGTEPGPGRVDAFGAARNLLFPNYAMKMQSPVSFPFIWDVPDTTQQRSAGEERWIHYDGNTNSILERNIGQALGLGAVFDPDTYESSLRIANLHRLEVLTHKLQPPKWPTEMLGAVDEANARTGAQIFQEKCQSCHQDRLVALVDVATDPARANSFGQPVGATPFPKAVAPILTGLKKRAFQDDGVTDADQVGMDANPVIWRATGQYMARSLHGIWATAPYLHNGSVPTLYDLLHPEQRPAKFIIGGREYDPQKIGYRSQGAAAVTNAWTYDTTLPGNSNIGHTGDRFGTTLPESQKAALLEFLKTL